MRAACGFADSYCAGRARRMRGGNNRRPRRHIHFRGRPEQGLFEVGLHRRKQRKGRTRNSVHSVRIRRARSRTCAVARRRDRRDAFDFRKKAAARARIERAKRGISAAAARGNLGGTQRRKRRKAPPKTSCEQRCSGIVDRETFEPNSKNYRVSWDGQDRRPAPKLNTVDDRSTRRGFEARRDRNRPRKGEFRRRRQNRIHERRTCRFHLVLLRLDDGARKDSPLPNAARQNQIRVNRVEAGRWAVGSVLLRRRFFRQKERGKRRRSRGQIKKRRRASGRSRRRRRDRGESAGLSGGKNRGGSRKRVGGIESRRKRRSQLSKPRGLGEIGGKGGIRAAHNTERGGKRAQDARVGGVRAGERFVEGKRKVEARPRTSGRTTRTGRKKPKRKTATSARA